MLSLLDFCNSCRTRGTTDQYRQSLCLFFECLSGIGYEGRRRPQEHVALMEQKSIEYLSEKQDYVRDLLKFGAYLSSYSPAARNLHVTTTILWLELNDIIIPKAKRMFIKNRLGQRKPITKDHPVSHDEIKRWYEHLSRVSKVVLLMQMSSGMRIGEVLALMPGDVDFSTSPVTVHVRGTKSPDGIKEPKNGSERYTFISTEAAFALKEWLDVRDAYMESTCKRTGGSTKKDPNDPRLIPVCHNTIQTGYTNGLKKAGLHEVDQKTRWSTISSHSLRKYFISQMKAAGMPGEMVELIAGHEGYLSDSYRRFPVQQVRDAYLQSEHVVSLTSTLDPIEFQNEKNRSNLLASEIIRLSTKNNEEIESLKSEVEGMRKNVVSYQDLENFYKTVEKKSN